MSLALQAYRLLTGCIYRGGVWPLKVYAALCGGPGEAMRQRLGYYPTSWIRSAKGGARIWIHAASVGEVKAAAAIMTALKREMPGCGLVFSTYTTQGRAGAIDLTARTAALSDTVCVMAPLDAVQAVRRAMSHFSPHVAVFLETELWPNWLHQAQRLGIKTVLVNGRISDRSIRRYLKIRRLLGPVLAGMAAFSMITKRDAQRISRLGAPLDRISVAGNAKFDGLMVPDQALCRRLCDLYGLESHEPVFVAGSIRGAEDEMVIGVFKQIMARIPQAAMVLAPRHLNKVGQIEACLQAHGLDYVKRSELKPSQGRHRAPVIVLDTMGELPQTYGVASVVFCGGSLVPLGGHNVLEPAAWGKPVLFGPFMGDFTDAKKMLLEAGGAIEVKNAARLQKELAALLLDPERAREMGRRAQSALVSNKGAAQKHAAVIAAVAGESFHGIIRSNKSSQIGNAGFRTR